ncbi:MAG: response regulator transcription factor [Nitrospirae bacterium]|nr:MAG: response regulator transcription factor [Nitrospirota bacterium]
MKHPPTHLVTASSSPARSRGVSKNPTGPDHHTLSEREFEVPILLAQGQSVKNIAQSLTLSIKTVSTYRVRLLDRLQLTTTAELIRFALDHHLVE